MNQDPRGRSRRIEYLRDVLTQMGHETSKRIEWENELEELLKQLTPTKLPEKDPPQKIKGSFKPRKCNNVAWNRKLLEGWRPTEMLVLPIGFYRTHTRYIIPPYLDEAWKLFRQNKIVFGKSWGHLEKSWQTKSNRKRIRADEEVCNKFCQHVDEFFRLAPCVPYYEQRDRFPKYMLEGDGRMQLTRAAEVEMKRQKAERELLAKTDPKIAEEMRYEKNYADYLKGQFKRQSYFGGKGFRGPLPAIENGMRRG